MKFMQKIRGCTIDAENRKKIKIQSSVARPDEEDLGMRNNLLSYCLLFTDEIINFRVLKFHPLLPTCTDPEYARMRDRNKPAQPMAQSPEQL